MCLVFTTEVSIEIKQAPRIGKSDFGDGASEQLERNKITVAFEFCWILLLHAGKVKPMYIQT